MSERILIALIPGADKRQYCPKSVKTASVSAQDRARMRSIGPQKLVKSDQNDSSHSLSRL